MNNLITKSLFVFFLYAETHYSFKGIYSRLKKKEPEIIVDTPHRIEPGESIPVLLLCKDAHRFPIRLGKIRFCFWQNRRQLTYQESECEEEITSKFWHRIVYLNPPEKINGTVQIDVAFEIERDGKTSWYRNDNYRISSHQPLEVYVAEESLPALPNWYFGDLHYHSSYTDDQVEFGAPLEASVKLAKAMGLRFFGATDHSYDLDDHEDDPLRNHPELPKWRAFQSEVRWLNEKEKEFVIIPGEEVSCGNSRGRNVHFLILNNSQFIKGMGDSAEKWFHTRPEWRIKEILERIEQNALAFAAHPEITPPFLQWLLVRRGRWQKSDYQPERLNGLQIWNGLYDNYFHQGLNRWLELLLEGKKIFIVAGNDAHGNFNRFRQIGFPFLTFRDFRGQIFGRVRTGIYVEGALTLNTVVEALRTGRALITDGPMVEFTIENEAGHKGLIGGEITGRQIKVKLRATTSSEFGSLKQLKLFHGDLATKKETLYRQVEVFDEPYNFQDTVEITAPTNPSYFRVVLFSQSGPNIFSCFTNPIWVRS